MKQSKKIAVTGGIGSGKSSVIDFLREQGYPVFSCDQIYAELLGDSEFLNEIEKNFKGAIKNGKLDRQKLSALVFSSARERERLDKLTHPKIMDAAIKKMDGYKLSFLEVPLLFEGNFQDLFDGVIVILRDKEERINSIVARDKISRNSAILRIYSQFNYDNCDFAKYYVIHNNSNLEYLQVQTLKILEKIREE